MYGRTSELLEMLCALALAHVLRGEKNCFMNGQRRREHCLQFRAGRFGNPGCQDVASPGQPTPMLGLEDLTRRSRQPLIIVRG